jgi:diguanylate cyclase (GGDEF)-like protein
VTKARVWRWWLAGGLAVISAYALMPAGSPAATIVYNVVGLVSGLAILAGVRLHRPERPAMWYWFAASQLVSVVGDLVYEYYDLIRHEQPYPSLADVFYLASYPMVVVGLLLLVRRRPGGGAAGLLEAAIVAIGLGLAFWVFVLHPIAAASGTSSLERWISTTYPAADVLLLAMLARLFTGHGGRTASTRLIGSAGVLVLAADTAFSLVSLYSDADLPLINVAFLLSYLCWGTAALHPSITGSGTETAGGDDARPRRMVIFGAVTMIAPALILLPGVDRDRLDECALAIGSVVLFLLVTVRMSQFMHTLRKQAAELERMAMADDLTGLANHRRLDLELRAVPAGACPQVALLGLNGFKSVNDELGRPAGDQVLTALAERLAAAAPAGSLLARVGGDEFAVLLPDADAGDAGIMAERLVAALRSPVAADGRDLLVGVAVGLAGGGGLGPVELLRQAEAAMHAAKLAGEPVRRWTPALDERSTAYARLGAELRTALDAGQFHMVYQPIVELPSERVYAVEALVRWNHPERGTVSPVEFIPVAEQNGLIVELGAWILRTACVRLASWRATLGPAAPDRVSVNVSAKQLARPGFAAFVAAVLESAGLPPECLAVEVTETAVFEGGPAVTALHELRALGVRIALDDFGTGHSSLGLLQTVPVDTIKVDKSFVDDITSAGHQSVIAEALIRLSSGLGLAAVAEGVETAEQAAALSRLGYRYLQGYYYGKPVADPDFGRIPAVA